MHMYINQLVKATSLCFLNMSIAQGPSSIRGRVVNDNGADCRNVDCSPVSYLLEAWFGVNLPHEDLPTLVFTWFSAVAILFSSFDWFWVRSIIVSLANFMIFPLKDYRRVQLHFDQVTSFSACTLLSRASNSAARVVFCASISAHNGSYLTQQSW